MMYAQSEADEEYHEQLLAQIAEYMTTLSENDIDSLGTYLSQLVDEPENEEILAQTSAQFEDENLEGVS